MNYDMTERSRRAEATRDGIVRAGLELLLAKAYDEVTLTGIARSAGVSHQTVLNHFGSKEGVAAAVADELTKTIEDLRTAVEPGDVAGAVHAVVEQYEHSGDANVRWAMAADKLDSLAPRVEEARRYHQDWLRRTFADDLPTDPAARRRAVGALHAATDVYTWKLLRRDLRLSRSDTEQTMADLVVGVLRGPNR